MRLVNIMQALEAVAPLRLAEDWDKVGLHVGDPLQNIRRVLLCIDLTPDVYEEAIERKCELVVSYHPPIFKPLDHVTAEDALRTKSSWKEDMVYRLIRHNIAVYSPHTALDAVRGGVNDWLCEGLGKHVFRGALKPTPVDTVGANRYKVVVYVPNDATSDVRQAMFDAGAGGIGDYRDCSFNAVGIGTFTPVGRANPAIGKVGVAERVAETRIETICSPNDLGAVIRAIKKTHPYEEPAFDVFLRVNPPQAEDDAVGGGRIHRLRTPITVSTLVRRVKNRLGVSKVKVAVPTEPGRIGMSSDGRITEIAVCVGAGGSVFETYPPVCAYVTGEMNHHQVVDIVEKGGVVILAGHTNTERPFLPTYREMLLDKMGGNRVGGKAKVAIEISQADRSPTQIV